MAAVSSPHKTRWEMHKFTLEFGGNSHIWWGSGGGGGGGGGRCATTARWSCTQQVNLSADSYPVLAYCTGLRVQSYVEAVRPEDEKPSAEIKKGYKHA